MTDTHTSEEARTTSTSEDTLSTAEEENTETEEASEETSSSETEVANQGQIYNKDKKESEMASLFQDSPTPPSEGDIVEGPVIGLDTHAVYVDLAPFGTGIIYGRELMHARDIVRRIRVGDPVSGKVVEPENEEGYTEISLKEARQAIIWAEAEDAIKEKTPYELTVDEANKGGLMLTWQGIQGFLPASQLNAEHYPRVEDGDKDRILDELRLLVGEKLTVTIITAEPREGKLIFSEKTTTEKEKENILEKYTLGDVLEGEVTGIVDFGVFVKVEEGLEGLVHISELDWGLVENPRDLFSVGEKVKVKVIEIKDDKVSLSIKALRKNPWEEAAEKYKKGDTVEGVIIKFNKHGALASIEEGVAGLVHVSEFGNEEKLREELELGKTYPFTITHFDPADQKMTLSSG